MATVGKIGGEETIIGGERAMAMTMSEGKKKQRIIQNTIRLATCSELRRGILLSLREGKKALSGLREELEVSSTTAIHALRELERKNFVFEDEDRDYALTKIGGIIALKLGDFLDAIDVLKKHEDFWLTHDLSGIPPHLLEKIGWLRDSDIIECSATDVFKVYYEFIDMLKDAKEIRGVSFMFFPEYPSIFRELIAKKQTDIQLVMTEEVTDRVLEAVGEEFLKNALTKEDYWLKLYTIKEAPKAAFTVTDYFFSLGFFNPDGSYDWNIDLISYDKKAIAWGVEFFEWYLKQAKRFYF